MGKIDKDNYALIYPIPETFLLYCPNCGLLRSHSIRTIPWTANDILTSNGFTCERCNKDVDVQFLINKEKT